MIRRGILALAALLLAPFIFVMTFVVGLQDFKNHMGQLPPVKTGGLQTATRDQTVD